MMITLKHEDVPNGWAVCFLESCKRKNECLRYKAGLTLPNKEFTTYAVAPAALKKAQCPCFRSIGIVRIAAGFKGLMEDLKVGEMRSARLDLIRLLNGRSNYYRYLNGKHTLSPKQQEEIRKILHAHGYDGPTDFDSHQDRYCFNEE